MEKRLYIETWGCQMNRHQSEGMAGVLRRAGYRLTERIGDADVVIFNGCMVRQKAEDKVYGRIGAVVEEKRRREVLLGVGGCLGEIRAQRLLERFPAVDFVFGVSGHAGLPELIDRAFDRARPVSTGDRRRSDEVPSVRFDPVTAMVTITEGCSNACSYCIVPRARGPMRSRAPERILSEVTEAVSSGYREVLLLGQNVNSYGQDREGCDSFVGLLRRVAAVGVDRIRFASSHPADLSPELLDLMAAEEAICPHLHVACQSGSDRVLEAMNRGYTKSDFLTMVERARSTVEGMNVTTDLIVGFPGESRADFQESMDLMERGRFGSIFVAKYSPRPGTPSARRVDDVPAEEKQRRLQVVLARQREIALEENERIIGKEVEVLIGGQTASGGNYGRAADHRTVVIDDGLSGERRAGDLVRVRIEAASSSSLSGVALESALAGAAVRGRS